MHNCTGRGTEVDTEEGARSEQSMLDTMLGVFLKICPPNIVEAMATMNILGVLMFSLFFGAVLSGLPHEQSVPMIKGIDIFNQVVMGMVMAILVCPPASSSPLTRCCFRHPFLKRIVPCCG